MKKRSQRENFILSLIFLCEARFSSVFENSEESYALLYLPSNFPVWVCKIFIPFRKANVNNYQQ